MTERVFRIVNWRRFQHYRLRNPPWVKLHREILTSRVWVSGNDADRVLAIALMVIAATTDNKIPDDAAYVKRVAYLNGEPNFARLLELGFIEADTAPAPASTMLAKAGTEAEKRREETEAEGPVETVEIVEKPAHEKGNGNINPNPQKQNPAIEGERQNQDQRTQIVERGQQRLLQLRNKRGQRELNAVGDLLTIKNLEGA